MTQVDTDRSSWLELPSQPATHPVSRVFIGGCERSGTTFLAAQISRWTGLTFLPESPFLLEALRRVDNDPSRSLPPLILDHWRFRAWDLPRASLRQELGAHQPAQECMDHLARRYTTSIGMRSYQGWLEHTPQNTAHVDLLDRHFQGHRYINIVRDGRAVAASILKTDFGPTTVRSAAQWWQAHVLPGLLANWRDPQRVLLVRYEDLLMQPERSRQRILHFLSHSDQHQDEVAVRVDPYFQPTHGLVDQPADPTRAEAWKSTLSSRQVEVFESLAAASLTGLGYKLSRPVTDPSPRAARYVDSIVDSVRQACWQLPARVLHRWRSDSRRRDPSPPSDRAKGGQG